MFVCFTVYTRASLRVPYARHCASRAQLLIDHPRSAKYQPDLLVQFWLVLVLDPIELRIDFCMCPLFPVTCPLYPVAARGCDVRAESLLNHLIIVNNKYTLMGPN